MELRLLKRQWREVQVRPVNLRSFNVGRVGDEIAGDCFQQD